ncbi:MAG: DUF945 domain-containing protein [Gammaproteobacteria bacterium]|nr:DUF945 domain-containing protein [Gammaproteobacteria bacterium]
MYLNPRVAYGYKPVVALTDFQIEKMAPSVFTSEAAGNTSSRYSFIPTSEVVLSMRDNGWLPVLAAQTKARDPEKKGHSKHMLRFRHSDDVNRTAVVGEHVPEIVLMNSHDGKSSYQLHAGLFRYCCSNGMVVSDGVIEKIKVRHSNQVVSEVLEGSFKIIKDMPEMLEKIEDYGAIDLSEDERSIFASSAATLRWDEEKMPINCEDLLSINRRQDHDVQRSLWGTLNIIQENLLQGVRSRNPATRKRVTSRKVKSVNSDVRLNKSLWELTERMAELKS